MERIVIRPARASDAVDLARNWIEGAQHYVELDPQAFRVPSTDGLVAFFEESLKRPRSGDSVRIYVDALDVAQARRRSIVFEKRLD